MASPFRRFLSPSPLRFAPSPNLAGDGGQHPNPSSQFRNVSIQPCQDRYGWKAGPLLTFLFPPVKVSVTILRRPEEFEHGLVERRRFLGVAEVTDAGDFGELRAWN